MKLEDTHHHEILTDIANMYQKFNPGFALDYQFVDQKYQSQYASERRVASLSIWFAGLAVIISCLGLLGLSAYSAARRTKEIGIRKVLGSSAAGIVFLLCKDFLRLVFIAILIAVPISYHLLTKWLNNFAYSINLEWWSFIIAGVVSMLIALITTGGHAAKASLTNPSQCLRNE